MKEIIECLQNCIIKEEDIISNVDKYTTIICTHKKDVALYNRLILKKLYSNDEIKEVDILTNAHNEPSLVEWINNEKFHELQYIAIGATAMITENINLPIGAANGSTCTITNFTIKNKLINSIQVLIESSKQYIKLRRTKYKRIAFNNKWYFKSSFPLILAHAITGHKSQGATISNKTILIFRELFAPSLGYVMISRVTNRKLLQIVNCPSPDTFTPINIE